MTSPATQGLLEEAASKGCRVVAKAGDELMEIVIVQGEAAGAALEKVVREAATTYRALNTPQGMAWLMRRLSTL